MNKPMTPRAHPAAGLFPMMTGQELLDLTDDIRENGLLEPIVLHEGAVLDGRNRLVACERADVEPRFVEWDGSGGSPTRFVLSHNLHRRHLTTSQRAAIAVEALPLFEEEARKRQLSTLKQGDSMPVCADRHTRGEQKRAADEAAALVGVGGRTVARAKAVQERDPETFERVKEGKITVNAATERIGLVTKKYEPKPVDPDNMTLRQVQMAEAHKRRMVAGISQIAGLCTGLGEVDVAKVRAACTEDEVREWSEQARDLAAVLRRFGRSLNDNGESHE